MITLGLGLNTNRLSTVEAGPGGSSLDPTRAGALVDVRKLNPEASARLLAENLPPWGRCRFAFDGRTIIGNLTLFQRGEMRQPGCAPLRALPRSSAPLI
jgi:hypothetical protein